MSVGGVRVLIVAATGLLWLAGCETQSKLGDLLKPKSDTPEVTQSVPPPEPEKPPETTGSIWSSLFGSKKEEVQPDASLLGADPYDDLNTGKKLFQSGSYGLAEKHFRRAVEKHPRDAEAWIGLAASYDRLKRFELADRAYAQAKRILGPTVELLNNQGFSYILRGDYKRARTTLRLALRKDPGNPYVKNNIRLLEKSAQKGKGVDAD